MTRPPLKDPLIAVIGATGTGKSQLAVSLAQRYNGEIVNGDAMQLYAGMPIITNKIPVEERRGIPHHLLGCIGLEESTWVVGTFVQKAQRVIDEIRGRGRLPILVGGTHYYTQSLLFNDKLADDHVDGAEAQYVEEPSERWPVLQSSTESLLEELKRVDPVMADRWHPNDRRKIQRSLEIYLQTGRKASDIYAEQRDRKSAVSTPHGEETAAAAMPPISEAPAMRSSTLLFWVHANPEALRERLDKRVDTMLEQGLLAEVQALDTFRAAEEASGKAVDESRGIWVSIGYKEFRAYSQALNSSDTTALDLEVLKAEAIERTKIATRQYAKRQLRWIRIKLVNALAAAGASKHLYLLDGSDISQFDTHVIEPAVELAGQFLTSSPMIPADPSSMSDVAAEMLTPKRDYDYSAAPERWTRRHCESCGVTCVTEEQWGMHVKSKAHRKRVSKKSAVGREGGDAACSRPVDGVP